MIILWLVVVQILALSGCGEATPPDGAKLTGSSKTVAVRGEYARVPLDRVDGLSVRGGRLVVRGSATEIEVELPLPTDPAKRNRSWALVTETMADSKRSVTFTHETTLEDFSLDLPESDAHLFYGGLTGTDGADLLVFAWGSDSLSYWGYVTISRQ
jgi:hypothetical protein